MIPTRDVNSQLRPRQESEGQLLRGSHIFRRHSAPQTSLSIAYPGLRSGTPSSLTDIYALYFDDDIGSAQGTERLLDLQNVTTVQPSELRLQDTVSPSETLDQELATVTTQSSTTARDKQPVRWEERSTSSQLEETTSHQLRKSKSNQQEESKSDPQEESTSNQQDKSTSNQQPESRSDQKQERASNQQEQQSSSEVKSSATATGSQAQKLTTPRNAMQPLRDAHMVDSGNASESPNQVMDTLRPLSELKHTSVQVPGTTQNSDIPSTADEGNTGITTALQSSPEIRLVNANVSGDSNDPERRLSFLEVDPLVADLAAADSSHTAQTLRKPFTVLADDEVDLSVGNAETNPGNISSPSSVDQATSGEVDINRDASFGKDPPVSGLKGFFERAAGIFKMTPSYTKDEIISMAAHDYSLEHLENGIAVDEFNQRIKEWKEFEDSIVREEIPFRFPNPLDYGKEWQVFYALQIWYYEQWHREKNGKFPPGYRTLFNSSEDEILNRSLPVVFRVSKKRPDANER